MYLSSKSLQYVIYIYLSETLTTGNFVKLYFGNDFFTKTNLFLKQILVSLHLITNRLDFKVQFARTKIPNKINSVTFNKIYF